MKRKAEEEKQLRLFVSIKKRLRSKLPQRRRRFGVSPVLRSYLTAGGDNCSLLGEENLSSECNSGRGSAIKRHFKDDDGDEFRRVTRACSDWSKGVKREFINTGEVSESSCVDSCSGAVSGQRNVNSLRVQQYEAVSENKKVVEAAATSETTIRSEISAVTSFAGQISRLLGDQSEGVEDSHEINSIDVDSVHSVLQPAAESELLRTSEKLMRKSENRDEEERESVVESRKENVQFDFDFTCSENLTSEIGCDNYSHSSAYSELQSELFGDSSELDFSDYTPSIWNDSGSQFSEGSTNGESPSPTFQLFLQFSQEFCRSTFALDTDSEGSFYHVDPHEITLLGLEEKDDEESYRMIRIRERRQVYFHDYAEEYCSSTNYGDLIVQQRLQMVHWIVEQSGNKDLQRETLFLGVSLLDRFLSKGYFRTKRNLQIAGIACLTLATRIEENQPYNSIQQKIFHIGSNAYSRCEVVAMEWLVQEVLKFQCFLPSLYNFLWFYLRAAKASEKVEKTVNYIAVLALLGHEQLCFWPSTVAAGLVILASIAAKQEASCYNIRQIHARMKEDHLPECMKV
ncbi:OLC1v1033023C1 [Oldenlandia corymbosa var. corymbosa]|uniref:OLC1v1033023C1 n=1 Tax=Oldenlandia corymbosa var. corymbosa TaxID=529605 RepID=A0AAV1CQ34_OLDCO|nr:OLC1v1033023C1 [Oldenlandia corymbosa var. corymbosa]